MSWEARPGVPEGREGRPSRLSPGSPQSAQVRALVSGSKSLRNGACAPTPSIRSTMLC